MLAAMRTPLMTALAGTLACGLLVAPAGAQSLLGSERIRTLPEADRPAWQRYLETSRREAEADRRALAAELAALGRKAWTPAPAGPPEVDSASMSDDERTADVVVSFQTPAGGWSKGVDLARRPRRRGESYAAQRTWEWIGTFDNGATTEQLRVLAAAYRKQRRERHLQAFLKGLEYILRAQYPNGGWPQVYPLEGGYHDAITLNDNAMTRVLELLREVSRGGFDFAPEEVRRRAGASFERGVACLLSLQVVIGGARTVWCAQHDPLTLAPVKARAYEHPSLSGLESVGVLDLLMSLDSPDARVGAAVRDAAVWLRANAVYGYAYGPDRELVSKAGAGPLWARFYEIGTNRPIFSNRDSLVRYDWRALGEERRHGYDWWTEAPAAALARYEAWEARQAAKGAARARRPSAGS